MQVASLSVTDTGQRMCSPRLLEAAVCAVARWLDSYVCTQEFIPEECEPFALGTDVAPVLERMLSIVTSCLCNFPGEVQLHRVALGQLLHVLVRLPCPSCMRMWRKMLTCLGYCEIANESTKTMNYTPMSTGFNTDEAFTPRR